LLTYTSSEVNKINFTDLALGDKTTSVVETLDEQRINYLDFTVDENATEPLIGNKKEFILSFGNSQSHSINAYDPKKDHLFIYYLAKNFPNYNVLNLSAPNANLQEMFLGLVNAEREFGHKIKKVFVSCVFDDTREDGIRPKMKSLVEKNTDTLSKYASGKLMIENTKEENDTAHNSKEVLLKYKAENTINKFLEAHSEVYANRGKIKGQLDTQIYFFRNWVFGIKPTTKRKKIDVAYNRNLTALKDIEKFCKEHDIELFFYIAPLRHDIEIPYVKSEYEAFKKDVAAVHTTYNLENIVPGKYWGETNGDWVDFMHFKGEGHILLARELEKILMEEGVE
jgi:hypothetical protein